MCLSCLDNLDARDLRLSFVIARAQNEHDKQHWILHWKNCLLSLKPGSRSAADNWGLQHSNCHLRCC